MEAYCSVWHVRQHEDHCEAGMQHKSGMQAAKQLWKATMRHSMKNSMQLCSISIVESGMQCRATVKRALQQRSGMQENHCGRRLHPQAE